MKSRVSATFFVGLSILTLAGSPSGWTGTCDGELAGVRVSEKLQTKIRALKFVGDREVTVRLETGPFNSAIVVAKEVTRQLVEQGLQVSDLTAVNEPDTGLVYYAVEVLLRTYRDAQRLIEISNDVIGVAHLSLKEEQKAHSAKRTLCEALRISVSSADEAVKLEYETRLKSLQEWAASTSPSGRAGYDREIRSLMRLWESFKNSV